MRVINKNNISLAIKGALASTLVLLALLIVSLFVFPNSPEEFGGYLYGIGMASGLLPLILILLFIYYFILSAMKIRSFNVALFIQLILFLFLAAVVYVDIRPRESAVSIASVMFIFLSISGAIGAWAWSSCKNT